MLFRGIQGRFGIDGQIVDVGNALIRNNTSRYDKELRSAVTLRSGHVYLFQAPTPNDEAEFVADRIVRGLQTGHREKADYAVLGRVNWVLNPISLFKVCETTRT